MNKTGYPAKRKSPVDLMKLKLGFYFYLFYFLSFGIPFLLFLNYYCKSTIVELQ